MKKYLILSLVVFSSLLISCRGPQGEPGRDGLVNSKIIDIQINQNEWVYAGQNDNNYFYGTISVPELTWDIYNNGIVKMYREYNTNTPNASQIELPFVKLNETPVTVDNNTQWVFYTETVDYEFTQGSVTIFYTASDFDYELNTTFVPEAMHFRLVIMW
ncbi:MAG: hypothetical protein IJS13_05745 [Paludibacteraceae bacterium]|nr:hypothetical protein [Paludibacteraceae bacterium]